MDRRLIVLMVGVLAAMGAGAAVVVADRPVEHLLPLADHLGAGRRSLPIEALFAAPVGLLLNMAFVLLRRPKGDSEAAMQRRRWSSAFLVGVAVLFAALEEMEIGVIYGWFPVEERMPRLLLVAAALWMVFAANGAAKLIVLGRSGEPASPRLLILNRFGALVGLMIGLALIPISLWSPLSELMALWLIAPLALTLFYIGRAAILSLDARSAR